MFFERFQQRGFPGQRRGTAGIFRQLLRAPTPPGYAQGYSKDAGFLWTILLDTNRVIGYDTVAKEKHDTIAKVDPDTSTAAVDSTMLTDVSVSGSFGYGILDNRNGVAVQSLDETFKKVVATFPTNVAAQGTYTVPKANFRLPYARAIYSGTATDLVHGKTMMLNGTLRALVSVQGGAGLANINVLTFLKSAYMQSQLQSPGAEAGRAS